MIKNKKPFYKRKFFLYPLAFIVFIFLVLGVSYIYKVKTLTVFFNQAFKPEINLCQEINKDMDFCTFKVVQGGGVNFAINLYFPLIHIKNSKLKPNNLSEGISNKIKKDTESAIKKACFTSEFYAQESVENMLYLSKNGMNMFNPEKSTISYYRFRIKHDQNAKIIDIPMSYLSQTKKIKSPIPFIFVTFDKNFENWVYNFLESVNIVSFDKEKINPIYGYYCHSNKWVNIPKNFKKVRKDSFGEITNINILKKMFDNNYNIFNLFNLEMYNNVWFFTQEKIEKESKMFFPEWEDKIKNIKINETKEIDEGLSILQKKSKEIKEGENSQNLRKTKPEINLNPVNDLLNGKTQEKISKDIDNASKSFQDETQKNIENNIKKGNYLFK